MDFSNNNLKRNIIIIVFVLLVVFFVLGITISILSSKKTTENFTNNVSDSQKSMYIAEEYDGETYYIYNGDYTGEYDLQVVSEFASKKDSSKQDVMSYEEYEEFCIDNKIDQKYEDSKQNYIVFSKDYTDVGEVNVHFGGVEYDDEKKSATLYIWDSVTDTYSKREGYIIIIPTKEKVKDIETKILISRLSFNLIKKEDPLKDSEAPTEKELEKMAKAAYIDASNEEVNAVYNKMLDNMVKQHTVKMKLPEEKTELDIDIQNCVMRFLISNEEFKNYSIYYVFGDLESIIYTDILGMTVNEKNESIGRENILKYLFGDTFSFEGLDEYTVKLKEKENQYLIDFKTEDSDIVFTINKKEMLLEKVEYKELGKEIDITYDKEEILLPEKYWNMDEQYVLHEKEDNKTASYSIYEYDDTGDLDNIYFEIPEKFGKTIDNSYKKSFEYEGDNGAYIICTISTINANSVKSVMNILAENNDVSSDEIYSVDVNGLKWSFIGFEGSNGREDYGAFEYEGDIYLCEYFMDYEIENEDCFEDIIWSIKPKR